MAMSECIAEVVCLLNGMFHGKPFLMHASFMGFVGHIVYVVIVLKVEENAHAFQVTY